MIRQVRGADRRNWTVRSSISWTRPAMSDQFEHDMAAGYVSGIAMLGVVAVLTLFVVFWTPVGIPTWFALLILLILLMLPMLWAVQRPWVVIVHTDEPIGTEGEHWEGVVRGLISAREEADRIADKLRTRGMPDDGTGVLTRLTSAAPLLDS